MYLVLADEGNAWFKILLLFGFVVLAHRAGVPALRAFGIGRDKTEFRIRNWFSYKSEFEGPQKRKDDEREGDEPS